MQTQNDALAIVILADEAASSPLLKVIFPHSVQVRMLRAPPVHFHPGCPSHPTVALSTVALLKGAGDPPFTQSKASTISGDAICVASSVLASGVRPNITTYN